MSYAATKGHTHMGYVPHFFLLCPKLLCKIAPDGTAMTNLYGRKVVPRLAVRASGKRGASRSLLSRSLESYIARLDDALRVMES